MSTPETNKPDDAERAAREIVKQLIRCAWIRVEQSGFIRQVGNRNYGVLAATLADECVLPVIRRLCKPDLPKLPKDWKGRWEVSEMLDGECHTIWVAGGTTFETMGGGKTANALRDLLNAVDARQKGGE